MPSMSKNRVVNLLGFIIQQGEFVLESTKNVASCNDFMLSMDGMVLFNSTNMCLQTIGETVRQVDELTAGKLLPSYPAIPWQQVKGMRNFISHEYLSIDPSVIFATIKTNIRPMMEYVSVIKQDILEGKHDDIFVQL